MTDHVSDLQWDREFASELTTEASEAVHAHAGTCTACSSRLRELTAHRDAFALRPIGFSLEPDRRSRWRWALPVAPVLAAVAIVLAFRARDERGERPKGSGPVLLLSAGRPDALAPIATGDVVHPGDYVQAGYTAARDGFGTVLSRDGVGGVTVYVPPGGDEMVPLAAGAERPFPRSTILDGVVGRERIAIAWCETAQPLATLLDALRGDRPLPVLDGCAVREVVLDKRRGSR